MTESAAYRVSHTTTYSYETPVRVCHNLVMLSPRHDWVAHSNNYRVNVKPQPLTINRREDYFGNTIHAFSIEESHRQLTVTASGRIVVKYEPLPDASSTPPWEQVSEAVISQTDLRWLEACMFRFPSERIQIDQDFAAYARESFLPARPILSAAFELTQRIYRDFKYDPQATSVHTPTKEAFVNRHGVCQDFAHIQIACLRSLGLCARYVSGYLRTLPPPGQEKLVGADQSHAWLSLYCGQKLGWVDLDPTNNQYCHISHIPIAWGRDYADVVPIRGVFLGGGSHHINVSVDVSPA